VIKKKSKSELGNIIRDSRLCKGIKQAQFARDLGISCSYIAAIESGRIIPPLHVLKALESELGVSHDELMTASGKVPEDVVEILCKNPSFLNIIRNAVTPLKEESPKSSSVKPELKPASSQSTPTKEPTQTPPNQSQKPYNRPSYVSHGVHPIDINAVLDEPTRPIYSKPQIVEMKSINADEPVEDDEDEEDETMKKFRQILKDESSEAAESPSI
jgi:transcriptional regulator with XRE-family HTH domain